ALATKTLGRLTTCGMVLGHTVEAPMPLRRSLLLLAFLFLPAVTAAQPGPRITAQAQPACGQPAAIDDGWAIDTPASVGLDAATLCALTDRLKSSEQTNMHSVLVVRRGRLVFEQYFAGEDQAWGRPLGRVEFGPKILHDARSVSKSV